MKLRFHAIGSVATVPVFDATEQGAEESAEVFASRVADHETRKHVTIAVRRVDRPTAVEWGFRFAEAVAEDAARIDVLKAAGRPTPLGWTSAGAKAIAALNREVLEQCLVSIHGVEVDETDLETVPAGPELVALIEGCDLLGAAAMAARRAQTPTPIQSQH